MGIGTSSPSEKLHIQDGNLIINNTPSQPAIQIYHSDANQLRAAIDGYGRAVFGYTSAPGTGLATGTTVYILAGGASTVPLKISGSGSGHTGNLFQVWRDGTIQRFVIQADGNVGIGTSSPGQKLDVVGNIRLNNGNYLQINDSSGYERVKLTRAALEFYESVGTISNTFTNSHMKLGNLGYGSLATFLQSSDNVVRIWANGALSVGQSLINNTSPGTGDLIVAGKVGIGTSSPSYPLDVNGTIKTNGEIRMAEPSIIRLGTAGLIWESGANLIIQEVGRNFFLGTTTENELQFKTNNTARISIMSDGKVGIGTTTPSQKLTVIGTVNATNFVGDGSGLTGVGGGGGTGIWNRSGTNVFLNNSGDKVGIGTSSPSNSLQIGNAIFFNATSGNVGLGEAPLSSIRINVQGNRVMRFENAALDGFELAQINTKTWGFNQLSGGHTFQIQAHAKVNSDLTVDTDTLFVDASENAVGIGTDSPESALHIIDNPSAPGTAKLILDNTGGSTNDEDKIEFRHGDYEQAYIKTILNVGWPTDLAFGTATGMGSGLDERMRIKSTGNVGINTTTPLTALEVVGTITATNFVGDGSGLTGVGGSGGTGIWNRSGTNVFLNNTGDNVGIGTSSPNELLTVSNSNILQEGGGGIYAVQTVGGSDVRFQYNKAGGNAYLRLMDVSNNTDFEFNTNGDSWLNGGNVGIGTDSPTAELTIKNSADNTDMLSLENAAGTRVANFGTDVSGDGVLIVRDSSGNVKHYLDGDTSTDTYFNAGNVGIGTNSPLSKLQIGDGSGTAWTSTSYPALWIYGYDNEAAVEGFRVQDENDNIDFRLKSVGDGGTTGATAYFRGNVGIGTSSPATLLHTNSSGQNYLKVETTGASSQAALQLKTGTANADWITYIPESSTDLRFYRGADRMVLDASGNLQIDGDLTTSSLASCDTIDTDSNGLLSCGTDAYSANTWRGIDDSPVNGVTTESISSNWAYDHDAASSAHHVKTVNTDTQDLGTSGTTITLTNSPAVTAPYATYSGNTNSCNKDATCETGNILTGANGYLYLGGTDMFLQDNSGNLVVSSSSTASYKYDSTNNGVGFFQIASGTDTVLKIDNAGKVGIGTTSPASKLSVGGTGSSNYAISGQGALYGVFGATATNGGAGVYGYASSAATSYGLRGHATNGYGVYASGSVGAGYMSGNLYVSGVCSGGDSCNQDIAEKWASEKALKHIHCGEDRFDYTNEIIPDDMKEDNHQYKCILDSSFELEFEQGDVICFDKAIDSVTVIRYCDKSYDKTALSTLSYHATMTIGADYYPYPIALTGNIPVKVICDNPIEVGDPLVTSNKQGYAMKLDISDITTFKEFQERNNAIFAKALEPCDSGKKLIRAWI
ncbi:hypothetical protein CEE44_03090 [Candidatus Woesearchaeota archaeon B3_Woes]|nr:MAG: hypothetical protein CEE44_03090 [Candidatus Woesearchaeota archaeon B3_Woes]